MLTLQLSVSFSVLVFIDAVGLTSESNFTVIHRVVFSYDCSIKNTSHAYIKYINIEDGFYLFTNHMRIQRDIYIYIFKKIKRTLNYTSTKFRRCRCCDYFDRSK
jgi:hypothetical protein